MSILNELKDKANHLPTAKDSFPEIQHIKDDVLSLARNVRNVSNDRANAATDYIVNRMNDLKESSKVTLDKMETQVKSKPSQSVAIAFAAGLAASYLFGRRSS
jgi:ElaB/YqjD/DUF883 family membrane-anchored ribosome-binding protein